MISPLLCIIYKIIFSRLVTFFEKVILCGVPAFSSSCCLGYFSELLDPSLLILLLGCTLFEYNVCTMNLQKNHRHFQEYQCIWKDIFDLFFHCCKLRSLQIFFYRLHIDIFALHQGLIWYIHPPDQICQKWQELANLWGFETKIGRYVLRM